MYLSLRTNGRETCTRRFVVRLLGPLTFLEHWPYSVSSGLWWTACNNRCATLHRLSFIRRSCFQRHFGFVAAQCVTIFKSTTLLQQRRIQAGGGGGGGVWGLQPPPPPPPLSYMVTPPLLNPFPAFCIGPKAPDSIPPPPSPPLRFSYRALNGQHPPPPPHPLFVSGLKRTAHPPPPPPPHFVSRVSTPPFGKPCIRPCSGSWSLEAISLPGY